MRRGDCGRGRSFGISLGSKSGGSSPGNK
jgi:hypothetical protein